MNDFRQNCLFDRIEEILYPKNKARLDADWPGLFRHDFLRMMPVEDLGGDFSDDFGRPTKEHYSICGLILLKDYFGWSTSDTVDKYLCDLKIQYALMLDPDNLQLSARTLERYLRIFRKQELARLMAQSLCLRLEGSGFVALGCKNIHRIYKKFLSKKSLFFFFFTCIFFASCCIILFRIIFKHGEE